MSKKDILLAEIDALLQENARLQSALEEARHQNCLLRFSFEHAQEAMFRVDEAGRIVDTNETACRRLGYSREELLSMTITEINPRYDYTSWTEHWQEMKKRGSTLFESQHRKKNGDLIPVEISANFFNCNGQEFICSFVRDLSDSKRREQRFAQLVDSIPAIVWRAEPESFQFTFVSPIAEKLLGYPVSQWLENPQFWQGHIHPEDREWAVTYCTRATRELRSHEFEYRMIAADGRTVWLHDRVNVMVENNRPKELIGVMVDITPMKEAAAEIERLKGFYESILDNLPVEMAIIDRDNRYRYVNPAGLSDPAMREWIIGKTDYDYCQKTGRPIEVAKTREKWHRRTFREQKIVGFIEKLRTKTGEERHYLRRYAPLLEPGGRVNRIIAYGFDLTEQIMAHEKLHESEARYRSLVDLSPDAIVVHADGKIIFANAAAARAVGAADAPELVGRPVMDFVHPESQALVKQRIAQMMQANAPAPRAKEKFLRLDGTPFEVEVIARPIIYEGRKAFLVIAHEITERKRAQEALRLAEERYRTLVERMPDGVYRSTPEGRFIEVNPAMVRMLGYESKEELLSVDIKRELYFDSRERERLSAMLVTAGDHEIRTFRLRRKDGKEVWVEDHGHLVRDEAGKVIFHEGILRDVTERKRAEEERKRLETKMLQAQKLESLGVLAGGIAHDFNNLLTGVLGNASLALVELEEGSPVRDYLIDIETAARRAAELCNQMLAYAGKGKFITQAVELGTTALELVRLLESSISKKIQIHYEIEENLPPILADAAQIRQVVMNLITNAADAIGDQPGIITVIARRQYCDSNHLRGLATGYEPEPGIYVCLVVKDTGCGMSPEIQQCIFDPFFTTKFTGRGLGLAAVLGIVRGHHGAIKVESTPGSGTAFTIYFPAAPESDLVHPYGKRDLPLWRGNGTILVADDEEGVLRVCRNILRHTGFTVLTARNGREAVEQFQAHAGVIDLLLLDMTMPELNGREVAQHIRELPGGKDVKILLSSGYSEQYAMDALEDCGLAGFMHKPFQAAELVEKIRQILAPK